MEKLHIYLHNIQFSSRATHHHIMRNTISTVLVLLLSNACLVNSFCKSRNIRSLAYGITLRNNELWMSASVDPLLSTQENAMINLFERVRPSVVYVSTFLQAFNPLLMNVMEIPSQTGSGKMQKLSVPALHSMYTAT